MSKLSYIQYLLIPNFNQQFLLINTKTYEKLTKLINFNLTSGLDDASDVLLIEIHSFID